MSELNFHLGHTIRQGIMTEDSWLKLRVKKWLSAPDANQECCRCLLVRLVHQKCVSCTKDASRYILYTERPSHAHFLSCKTTGTTLSGMQNYAHLKQFPFDRQTVGVSGANIFAHLRVSGPGTGRSIGVPDFQVRETMHT